MKVLSIFIWLTYFVYEVYKQAHIHSLDRPASGDRKPPGLSVLENNVTGSVLVVIDTELVGYDFQVLNAPVAWVAPHFGEQFRRVWHSLMVSHTVPLLECLKQPARMCM
jgi:hypothetical protein